MSEIDFTHYTNVQQVIDDIRTIKIQGATNVAIATFEGLKIYLKQVQQNDGRKVNLDGTVDPAFHFTIADLEKTGIALSQARPNEPLAQNGLKYILHILNSKHKNEQDPNILAEAVAQYCDEFLQLIKDSKEKIVENSKDLLKGVNEILTHCHSSTVEKVIINHSAREKDLIAICTETRPLFQGRITAANLLKGGVNTTLIADSAAESFIIGKGLVNIDVLFIGCDEITMQGDVVNKIGSWGLALAAYYANVPVYVIGSILKTNPSTIYNPPKIEMREAKEIWPDAPNGLKLVNPSFEMVNKEFITGFITEVGVIKPADIDNTIQTGYPWLV